jgi:hypothetical protein
MMMVAARFIRRTIQAGAGRDVNVEALAARQAVGRPVN